MHFALRWTLMGAVQGSYMYSLGISVIEFGFDSIREPRKSVASIGESVHQHTF